MRRVVFLISGPSHLPNLVVAIHTLRRYWTGPVDVCVWKESLDIMRKIAGDNRLAADFIPWEPAYRGHNDTFVCKTRLVQSFPRTDTVLFLDADVTVHGKLDHLFDLAEVYGFAASRWNDWRSNGSIIAGRIRSLLEFPTIDSVLVERAANEKWPSVNSGIFAALPCSRVFPVWEKWTFAAKTTFIPDEKTLHVIQVKFADSGDFTVAGRDGRFNCSPIYQPAGLKDEDTIIRHFHGDSNLRPTKSQRGFGLWWPTFQLCLQLNLGGIRDWRRGLNKHLDYLEKTDVGVL